MSVFRNTIFGLFDTRSLCICISSDSPFKWMSSSSLDSLLEDVSISAWAEEVAATDEEVVVIIII